MFHSKALIIALLVAVVSLPAIASSGSSSQVEELTAARDRVAGAAERTKGSPRQLREQEKARLNGLIDALERGGDVDAAEIDRALERSRPLSR